MYQASGGGPDHRLQAVRGIFPQGVKVEIRSLNRRRTADVIPVAQQCAARRKGPLGP